MSLQEKVRWLAWQGHLTPSRLLFGNESGVRSNIRARRSRSARFRSGVVHRFPDTELEASLVRDGFALAPGAIPQDALRAVRDSLWMCEDPARSVPMGLRISDSVRYLVDPLAQVPQIGDFLTPFVRDVVRAWFNSEFRIQSVRFWRIAPLPDGERSHQNYGNVWHLDRHHGQILKMFVQVSEATEEGAATRLVSSGVTRRALRTGLVSDRFCPPPVRRMIDDRTVSFDDPPGSLLFFDPDVCLHRAGVPPAGTVRGMVQFWFEPAESAPAGGDYLSSIPPDLSVLSLGST